MSFGGDYAARQAWAAMQKGMAMGQLAAIDTFLKLAQDHYWDSLEGHKDLILEHLKGIKQIYLDEHKWLKDYQCKDETSSN